MDFYKVNWDASLDSMHNKIGIDVVLRDHEAQVTGTLHAARYLNSNSFVAESMALLLAVQLCTDIGLHNLMLEGDALQVVRLLKDKNPDWSEGGLLIQDNFQMLNSMAGWSVHHVSRQNNHVAHLLAKDALLCDTDY